MNKAFTYCLAELCKVAEEKKKNPHLSAAKVIGTGLAGYGAGHLAGGLLAHGVAHMLAPIGGDLARENLMRQAGAARKIAPLVGAAGGIVYPIWQSFQRRATDDAVQSAHDQSDKRIPGQ